MLYRRKNRNTRPGKIRIIAGKWRRRNLLFPTDLEIRPTPDRVRETLFNWLANKIADVKVLDLFAGSGVLSFEALSRGAKEALLVDKSADVINVLQQNATTLNCQDEIKLVNADAINWLELSKESNFDLVFIDPPFSKGLAEKALQKLTLFKGLNAGALVYVETEKHLEHLQIPDGWDVLRFDKAGNVSYYLLQAQPLSALSVK